MIWHIHNENFILDSTRIFMKAFHLLLFHGSDLSMCLTKIFVVSNLSKSNEILNLNFQIKIYIFKKYFKEELKRPNSYRSYLIFFVINIKIKMILKINK
ncbi:hypothetical protein IEQ34_019734 [Dendrobium chrysotoxum]|uniref:Uncharacterized protein n=1 Tax=Dendrobium chrysotoxum TaxID=161865 RepID=A0AAV7G9F3_DENCH|nr:hypothetical protein IEQ34_019734 [Dendrobium chrysotoxum]